MKVTIHRGAAQIGGTVVTVETPSTSIALDAGLALEGADPTADAALRAVLAQARDGIFLSHSHPDHTGLLAAGGPLPPVFSSRGTSKLLLASSVFRGQSKSIETKTLHPEKRVVVGDLTVTGFAVDHSAPGAMALLVEHEGRRLLYSGDLRLHGLRQADNDRVLRACRGRVNVLLMEGTNLSRANAPTPQTEAEVHRQLAADIAQAKGLVLAYCSPQHIDRLKGIIGGTQAANRIFVADSYVAFVHYLLSSEEHGALLPDFRLPQAHYRVWLAAQYARRVRAARFQKAVQQHLITLADILQAPERYVLAFRLSLFANELRGVLPSQCTVLYSAWREYLEREPWSRDWQPVRQFLEATGGTLVQRHTTGHLSAGDWQRWVEALAPALVVPVHHQSTAADYAKLYPHVRLVADGEAFEV